MSEHDKMSLKLLQTEIPGLDEVLSGGLPEYSFNLVVGPPGSGKTTFVHQLTFANASVARPAIYFTVLGEPSLKMLRYQQQMQFFDPDKVGSVIRFIDLSAEVLEGDLQKMLDRIVKEVQQTSPGIVIVDSFRTLMRQKETAAGENELQGFLQRLALHLTSWQVTSFLVGEYSEEEMQNNPLFTIADGILWLTQSKERNSIVRKLEVMKMRGVAAIPGLHTFRISSAGLQVFPRASSLVAETRRENRRIASGVPGLDDILGGGLLAGDATLIAGPSGTGKTATATQFISEGARLGENGVIAIFEEQPADYIARAKDMGFDFAKLIDDGKLRVIYLRPLDLSADEILHQVQQAVAEVGATRLVVDSLNGLELAIAPNFRGDFRESLYRMVGTLISGGLSLLLTVEVTESFDQIMFSPHSVSFLAQNIIFLRYVEIESCLEKVIAVIKMRRSHHSRALHSYSISAAGLSIGDPLTSYHGILTGVPTQRERPLRSSAPGLTEAEARLLALLVSLREATLEALAAASSSPEERVSVAMARLVQLNYAVEVSHDETTVYRPVVRPLGQ